MFSLLEAGVWAWDFSLYMQFCLPKELGLGFFWYMTKVFCFCFLP